MQQTVFETEQVSNLIFSNFTLQVLYPYLLSKAGMRSVHCLYCLTALSGCAKLL